MFASVGRRYGISSTLAHSGGSDKGAAESDGRLLLSKTSERLALWKESAGGIRNSAFSRG